MIDQRRRNIVRPRHRRGWDGQKELAAAVLESAVRAIKNRIEFMSLEGTTPEEQRQNLAHLCLEWKFATSDTVYHQLLKIDPKTVNRRLKSHTTPEQRRVIHDAFSDRVALSKAMDERL